MFRIDSQNKPSDTAQYTLASLISANHITTNNQINEEPALLPSVLSQLEIDVAKCSPQVVQELTFLLTEVLHYPSAVDSDIHSRANRLGLTDLIEADSTVYPAPQNQSESQQSRHQHCKDCGLIVQRDSLPFCSSFREFPNAGIGIYLLFQCFKNIGILIALLGSIFSAYALYVNISEPSQSLDFSNMAIKISYSAVITHISTNTSLQDQLVLEGWLLLIIVVVWVVVLSYMNTQDIKIQQMIDQKTITASDFTVMIENLPFAMTKQELQIEFDQYYKKVVEGNYLKTDQIQNQNKTQLMSFKIKKVSKGVPFYLLQDQKAAQRLQEIEQQTVQLKEKFASWVSEVQSGCRFASTQKQERSVDYKKYTQLQKQREEIQGSKYSAFQSKIGSAQVKQTVFFVTFERSESANLICQLNPQSISQKFRQFLGCCSSVLYFKLFTQQHSKLNVKLSRAPQPEDINWQNIGMEFSSIVKRKFLTFFVTLLLLGISFGSVYGLTLLQLEETNPVLVYGTSIIITVVNELIATTIYKLTIYQRNMTKTSRQISLAIKTILAQLVNSIFVPLIVDVYYVQNIYYVGGLVQDVYYMAITNAILPPVLTLINSDYLIGRILAWYKSRPYPRLTLDQQQLNQYTQLPQYQLGYAYIYYLDCFYFTCFFVTMQPFLVIPSLIGVFLMYWTQKHRLLKRSSRPIPSTSLLADAMWQLIFLGPFVLTMGHLTWYNLLSSSLSFDYIYLSQILCFVISVTFFVLPIDSIMHSLFASPDEQMLDFDECWPKLKSDYDRLNPATKEQGLDVFMKFIEMFKDKKSSPSKAPNKQKQQNVSMQTFNFTEEQALSQNDKNYNYVQNRQILNTPEPHIPKSPQINKIQKERSIFLDFQDQQQNQKQINVFAHVQSKRKKKTRNIRTLQTPKIEDTFALIFSGTRSTKANTRSIQAQKGLHD